MAWVQFRSISATCSRLNRPPNRSEATPVFYYFSIVFSMRPYAELAEKNIVFMPLYFAFSATLGNSDWVKISHTIYWTALSSAWYENRGNYIWLCGLKCSDAGKNVWKAGEWIQGNRIWNKWIIKERGRNNFPNYASQLQAAFVRSQITNILK